MFGTNVPSLGDSSVLKNHTEKNNILLGLNIQPFNNPRFTEKYLENTRL